MTLTSLLRALALTSGVVIALMAGFVAACTPVRHILVTADPAASGPAAQPDIFEGLGDEALARRTGWDTRRGSLHEQLDAVVYGEYPANPSSVTLGAAVPVLASTQIGQRVARELVIETSAGSTVELNIVVIRPEAATSLRGVILVPTECGLRTALRDEALPAPTGYTPGYCNSDGMLADMIGGFFGEWVSGPPVAWLLERGYALIAWHESDIAPDSASLHRQSLERLGLDPDAADRPGSVSLWAWTISRVIDGIEQDPDLSGVPRLAYGHSRRGKAVLLAAARDIRISVTLAHQAGTGGSSLHGDRVGEPIANITQSYPHWFGPVYASYGGREAELPIDQHALIALIAPRAVLLGNAWRDTWSDPAGSFRAAQAASPAWDIYGETGLAQSRLDAFDPTGHIAVHIRPGTHGVTGEDWEAFLDFADAHTSAP